VDFTNSLFLLTFLARTFYFIPMEDFVSYDYQDFDNQTKELIEHAKQATHLSYAPYSNFFVGAALLLEGGTIVKGANQENASYPLCMCGERVALYSKSIYYPKLKILKMAVVARKEKGFVPAACCGACRQVMVEFEQRQASEFEVIMEFKPQKWLKCRSAAVLIPFQFEF